MTDNNIIMMGVIAAITLGCVSSGLYVFFYHKWINDEAQNYEGLK